MPNPEMNEADKNVLASRKLFGQGALFAKQGLWSEAEAAFIQSGRLHPTSLAWLGAAIAAWNQKRVTVAETCIEWALHAIPIRTTPEAQEGIERFEAKDWPGVEQAFRKLLSLDSIDTPTHLFLCISLINQGRLDEAREHLLSAWTQELTDSESATEA